MGWKFWQTHLGSGDANYSRRSIVRAAMATYIAQVDPEKDAVQISMEKGVGGRADREDAVEQKLVVALTEKDAIKKDLKRAQRKMKAMASKLAKKDHPDTPCENPACWLKEDELWDAERKMKAMASKLAETEKKAENEDKKTKKVQMKPQKKKKPTYSLRFRQGKLSLVQEEDRFEKEAVRSAMEPKSAQRKMEEPTQTRLPGAPQKKKPTPGASASSRGRCRM